VEEAIEQGLWVRRVDGSEPAEAGLEWTNGHEYIGGVTSLNEDQQQLLRLPVVTLVLEYSPPFYASEL
jgi:hypothetical protein